jgi:hypothetical protein
MRPGSHGQAAFVLSAAAALAAGAAAAEVRLQVSDSTVYVGVPFSVTIVLEDIQEYDPPKMPSVPGLKLVGGPSTNQSSSFHLNINGRTMQSQSVSLTYQYVVEEEGAYTIPALTIVADGTEFRTTPKVITAEKPQTGDLLFVYVKSDRDSFYLGETVELAMEIWIAPFVDGRIGGRLSPQAMLDQVDLRGSSFGPFAPGLRNVSVREAQRTGADGKPHAYYVYVLRASMTPRQAGPLRFDDVRVLMQYPVGVRARRSFFQDDMFETRPIVGTVGATSILVREPPPEGRPPTFTGAVGRFDYAVAARPTDVAVGDPITLTMTIEDRSPAPVDLDVLRPPDLGAVEALVRDFRVAADPPAGTVQGRRKTFTQTVRARSDQAQAIPAIPFSYFDPLAERYVTESSDPIPLSVRAAAAVTDAQIVGGAGPLPPRVTELTEVEGGVLANYTGSDLLLSQGLVLGPAHAAALLLPPGAVAGLAAGRWLAARRRGAAGRRRRAARTALRRLHAARGSPPEREAQETAAAVRDYVAERTGCAVGALTAEEAVTRLRRSVPGDLAGEVAALLDRCEQLRYSGAADAGANGMAERAAGFVRRLERERIS